MKYYAFFCFAASDCVLLMDAQTAYISTLARLFNDQPTERSEQNLSAVASKANFKQALITA